MTLETTTQVTRIHALTWATMLFAASQPGGAARTDFPRTCNEVIEVLQSVRATVSGEQASQPMEGVNGASNTAKLVEIWAKSLIQAASAGTSPFASMAEAKAHVQELIPSTILTVH